MAFVASLPTAASWGSAQSASRSQCGRRGPRMVLTDHEKLDVVFSSDGSEIARYRLDLEIPGAVSKEKRKNSIQAMKKNANFPGFRRGTLPPFVVKEIEGFVLRDSIEDMIDEAVKELNLSRAKGEEADPKYNYDAAKKEFVVGQDCHISLQMLLSAMPSDDKGVDSLEDIIDVDPTEVGPEMDLGKLQSQSSKPADQIMSDSS